MIRGIARRVRRVLRRGWRSASRDGTAARRHGYSDNFHLVPKPRDVAASWPDPPHIEAPAAPLHANDDGEKAPQRFDVALFEALNNEYASHPVATTVPQYDLESVTNRSRQRLAGIHRRIDLIGRTVLEVGCGSGMEVWHLAHQFRSDAWGIDIRERRAWPLLAGENVHLIAGDISRATELSSSFFDRVISNTVWEHLEHPITALSEIHRVMKPGAFAWIRANLYRGPTASHRAKDIYFPFPHLLFDDDVIAEGLRRAGKQPRGAAWVNRLTWEQYESYIHELGFAIRSLKFDIYPIDEAFYSRFEDVLGRYPRRDLERGFFTVILEKPR